MSKVVKGSFELMKKLNVEAILKVIKNNGSLSRADIAKLTGLTPASVTNITKILIESDYLIERVAKYYKEYAFHACKNTKIVRAELGNDAGMYGAAKLALG